MAVVVGFIGVGLLVVVMAGSWIGCWLGGCMLLFWMDMGLGIGDKCVDFCSYIW
jgi:hypothetical protein